jgi:sugar lactone lactonase YvrE
VTTQVCRQLSLAGQANRAGRIRSGVLAVAVALAWTGCKGSGTPAEEEPVTDAGPSQGDDDGPPPPDAATVACDQLPTPPVHVSATLQDFSGAEDFAFDGEGNLISIDAAGNLTRQPRNGPRTVVVPNAAQTGAGTRFLANGDLVVASVEEGAVVRITPAGGKQVLASGIAYPNGIEVDREGAVYVAEHDRGRVLRIDPSAGMTTVIAEGLEFSNGLSFSPDYRILYVGSFGGGTVHAIARNEDGSWPAATASPPVLLAQVPTTSGPTMVDGGGLDGVTVDACGNVYVTEYLLGNVWRISPTGAVDLLVTLPSEWIPNLHWGVGVGGWDAKRLYVIERNNGGAPGLGLGVSGGGRLFELAVGVPEKPRVFP